MMHTIAAAYCLIMVGMFTFGLLQDPDGPEQRRAEQEDQDRDYDDRIERDDKLSEELMDDPDNWQIVGHIAAGAAYKTLEFILFVLVMFGVIVGAILASCFAVIYWPVSALAKRIKQAGSPIKWHAAKGHF